MKKRRVKEHRINVRLPDQTFIELEKTTRGGNGAISLNAWINDAIAEKLQRDNVREPPANFGEEAQRTFYEFFAGGGMVRQALGEGWCCLFANDFDQKKARTYRDNWNGGAELLPIDIKKVSTRHLPKAADLVWASFPCQDLSLAGKNAGIGGQHDETQTRSGTFWPFWKLMTTLRQERRAPKVIALENVYGALTSNDGDDFRAICSVLVDAGYRVGAVVIDAKLFVPQSRPRVFIVAVESALFIDPALTSDQPLEPWHVDAMKSAYANMSPAVKANWIWWRLPTPPERITSFADIIETSPEGVQWNSQAETQRLLGMMNPVNLKKVEQAKRSGRLMVGGVYRRTRTDKSGERRQRAEVRFDNIAGCLRTPSGGSSRQLILLVNNRTVRSRLLSPREAARLMGLPESYKLPSNYNEAYHLCGDGVVVPAVRHLATYLLEPLIDTNRAQAVLPIGLPAQPQVTAFNLSSPAAA